MHSRRDFLKLSGAAWASVGSLNFASTLMIMDLPTGQNTTRCINVINFIREIEPRFKMDMMLPIQKQMEIILKHRLPATWLLQFDALVSGPFVPFLKAQMAKDHEVGFWFEMNERHCKAAGVEWRGRPGYEWDHIPHVAFTIGYTKEERIKLADTAMEEFKMVWGKYPSSVASWNLDSVTIAHLVEKYKVDAFAVCRDQIATDGFTIWGAPIAGYYPSKANCWSPALDRSQQIGSPIFRMLGQDPVYYYDRVWMMPDGKRHSEPDTMEPVWPSGRSPVFVREFLEMIEKSPTLGFAYAQMGQENTFPWDQQATGYPAQMEALAALRDRGVVHVETMGETGRRFKKAFRQTPPQAQVMLNDPFGNEKPAATVWYQSRFYRANLHMKGDLPYLRDLTVYSDRFKQPFLDEPTRLTEVEQRMPAVLDGYHWSKKPGSLDDEGAGGYFYLDDQRLRLTGKPTVREDGNSMIVELPVQDGAILRVHFAESSITVQFATKSDKKLKVSFEWDPAKSALTGVQPKQVAYRWQEFEYSIAVVQGTAQATEKGWTANEERGKVVLKMALAK
ncbi:MAG: hypothetical protein KF784_00945 [Fimbriimonadaceae bacterium]|nr:hypothetical protein [Fimbriimonadaceae bacterium]